MDVAKFREEFPDVAICQPIDCTQLLPFGTVDEVKSAVLKAIKDADARKILIGSTSEVNLNVPVKMLW